MEKWQFFPIHINSLNEFQCGHYWWPNKNVQAIIALIPCYTKRARRNQATVCHAGFQAPKADDPDIVDNVFDTHVHASFDILLTAN